MRTSNTPSSEPHQSSEPPTDSSLESLTMQCDAMKRQLRHAQKLAALGTTSAMLAHEYNNVLTPVISYAQYALDKNDVKLMRKTLNLVLKQHSAVQVLSDRVLIYEHLLRLSEPEWVCFVPILPVFPRRIQEGFSSPAVASLQCVSGRQVVVTKSP